MPTPYDPDKLADATLALLGAFEFDHGRAWKGYDFEVMARLHAEGMISNPHNRNASVHLTPEGLTRAKGRSLTRGSGRHHPPTDTDTRRAESGRTGRT